MRRLLIYLFCFFFFGLSAIEARNPSPSQKTSPIKTNPPATAIEKPSHVAQEGLCPVSKLRVENLNFGQLTDYIDRNASIRDVTTLIECLPNEFFQVGNFSAIYNSHGSESLYVDPDHPRVIMFNDRGDFAITFTGQEGSDDFEVVRILEFDHAAEANRL